VRILFVATRPPWPPADGGRVLMARTIEGLAARGHEILVLAPAESALAGAANPLPGVRLVAVPSRRRSRLGTLARSLASNAPMTIAAHRSAAVGREAARLLRERPFDVVHVEQMQALPQAASALAAGVPVVLRAQNVESDLWRRLADVRSGWRLFGRREANRLARWEAGALARVSATVALTAADAERLRALGGAAAQVEVVRAPMPASLPAAADTLAGRPAVVLFSGGWLPNRDGVEWFVRERWPAVSAALPDARLHVFGRRVPAGGGAGAIEWHPAPARSDAVFVAGSVMLVPLRIASGARIRILEAWARGVPVVATAEAAAGLDAADGDGLRIAQTAGEFAGLLRVLAESPPAAQRLVETGRAKLVAFHDPDRLAAELETVYRSVCPGSRQ
jgi:glycosyltransferase involved in cell wall biosynthesis